MVDILKAIQQGAELVLYRYQLRCTRWGAGWRHQANTIEPSVCSDSSTLCRYELGWISAVRQGFQNFDHLFLIANQSLMIMAV